LVPYYLLNSSYPHCGKVAQELFLVYVIRNRTSTCENNARLSFDKKCKHVRFLLTLDFLNLFFKEGGHFRYVCQGFDQVRQELSLVEGARVAHERESNGEWSTRVNQHGGWFDSAEQASLTGPDASRT